jgi:dipeptidase E
VCLILFVVLLIKEIVKKYKIRHYGAGGCIMRLILCGGGSDEQAKESYEVFVREVGGGKVIYIPLAWIYGNIESCVEWFKSQLLPFGQTDIEQILNLDDITEEKLKSVSGIFIGGGNTYQLLKQLKESKAFDNLKKYIENNGLVMGSSAGALVLGKNIDTCLKDDLEIKSCSDANFVGLEDVLGFDCVDGYSILPHYKKLSEQIPNTCKRVEKLLQQKFKLICLPEETSLYINGDSMQIIGQKAAEIFDGSGSRVIEPGEFVL